MVISHHDPGCSSEHADVVLSFKRLYTLHVLIYLVRRDVELVIVLRNLLVPMEFELTQQI